MCIGCWEKHGSPKILNERTRAAAELIRRVYDFSGVGGNLHVVVGDFNVDDGSVRWCLDNALKTNVHGAEPEQLAAERKCGQYLLQLGLEERASALAFHDGFFRENEDGVIETVPPCGHVVEVEFDE